MKALKNKTADKDFTAKATLVVLLGLVLTGIALLFPLAIIWALNTLFQLGLNYSFWNWLAIVVLLTSLQGALNIKYNRR